MIVANLEALAERLRAEEFYSRVRIATDGSQVFVLTPMIYTWAILGGVDDDGYARRWCYDGVHAALMAFEAWDGNAGTEPVGWHRNPETGRRRPDGDASREFAAW